MAVKLSALKVGDVLYQACPVAHRRRYWTYKVTAVGERFAEYRGGDGVEYVGGEETLKSFRRTPPLGRRSTR